MCIIRIDYLTNSVKMKSLCLHVLDYIRPRLETNLSANLTRNINLRSTVRCAVIFLLAHGNQLSNECRLDKISHGSGEHSCRKMNIKMSVVELSGCRVVGFSIFDCEAVF